ncbi:uncharacterized protein LOC121266307 [Juglans microcarpa x Juglans regia]|uniref:uncharacterized protein LOC121266307 n=1 Tax=Juglans microcarpa x Juglans regia TaxID=2249226 RepID=UPI001B7DD77C|nr:uncharacterized protein LOC121266307 [Juglans microcarpa x Juglans regia]
MSSIPHEVKLGLINEIAIEYSLHLGQLAYGNNHKQHGMQLSGKNDCEWEGFGFEGETGEIQVNDNTASGVHALVSYANDVPTDASSSKNPEYVYEPKLFPSNVSFQKSVETFCSEALSAASFDNRVKTGQTATSSEISFQFHRRGIVYLDEIQEFQFCVQDDIGEDKRIFMFNTTILPHKGNNGVRRADSFVSSQPESCESVTTIPETQHKRACLGDHFRRVKTSWKWWERRSDFKKSHSDQSCPSPAMIRNHDARDQLSYGSTCKFSSKKCLYHRFFQQNKHWRKMPAQEARSSSYKFHKKSLSHQQLEVHGKCMHNHRSSDCIIKDKFDWESLSWRQKRGMAALAGFSIHHFSLQKCLQVWNSPPKNPWGKNSKMASQADPIYKKSNQLGGAEVSDCLTGGGASSQESCSKASNRYAETERFARTTCSGTMTISPERPKSTISSRSHVHPKLPDYDELEAKFRALKQDYLQRTSAITSGLNIALA